MLKPWMLLAPVALAALGPPPAHAQEAPPNPEACVSITSDAPRLACYDRAFGRPTTTAVTPATAAASKTTQDGRAARRQALFNHDRQRPRSAPSISLLDSRWELSPEHKLGTFNVRGYKPVYLLPVSWASDTNNHPHSPAPGHSVASSLELDNLEAEIQISFKTKLVQGVFDGHGDLWFGYTQSSHWQIYNGAISRPFRETNYQPEALLVFGTDYDLWGWKGRLLGIGINHQSNGRSNPLSRSWNRVVANIGFERPGWTVMLRPWWRIREPRSLDDNPDIADYMGRGQMVIVHETPAGQEFTLMLRHSLRGGQRSHGAARFTWAFPIHAKLRGYVQLFHGYGESLIDYNHRATYVGLGVSLLGWY